MAIREVFLRTAFNYDMDAASDEDSLRCEDVSLAKQSFAEECDINTIVRQFGLTGKLPDESVRVPQFGDFDGIFDFHSAMNAIVRAEESFDRLPADVRYRFHNDPGAFVEFAVKPENLPELRKMGLAPDVVLEPVPVKGAEGAAEPAKPLDSAPKR
ncbi:MAG: internal scaffolding protein [Microvirus sp.]|nr:MAG: internal scaffolding protein [Microvirus sp.]